MANIRVFSLFNLTFSNRVLHNETLIWSPFSLLQTAIHKILSISMKFRKTDKFAFDYKPTPDTHKHIFWLANQMRYTIAPQLAVVVMNDQEL